MVPRTAREDARPQGGDGYSAWAKGDIPGHIVGTITSQKQLDSSLMVGDLITFKGAYLGPNEFGHVGIYIGNGQMLESPDTGLTVRVRSLRASEYSSGNMRGIHLTLPGDATHSAATVLTPTTSPRPSAPGVNIPTSSGHPSGVTVGKSRRCSSGSKTA